MYLPQRQREEDCSRDASDLTWRSVIRAPQQGGVGCFSNADVILVLIPLRGAFVL